ncbi:MAG: hypothetical protein Q9182_002459 [Xanthomendoza sp. 2 TL-2023]
MSNERRIEIRIGEEDGPAVSWSFSEDQLWYLLATNPDPTDERFFTQAIRILRYEDPKSFSFLSHADLVDIYKSLRTKEEFESFVASFDQNWNDQSDNNSQKHMIGKKFREIQTKVEERLDSHQDHIKVFDSEEECDDPDRFPHGAIDRIIVCYNEYGMSPADIATALNQRYPPSGTGGGVPRKSVPFTSDDVEYINRMCCDAGWRQWDEWFITRLASDDMHEMYRQMQSDLEKAIEAETATA